MVQNSRIFLQGNKKYLKGFFSIADMEKKLSE